MQANYASENRPASPILPTTSNRGRLYPMPRSTILSKARKARIFDFRRQTIGRADRYGEIGSEKWINELQLFMRDDRVTKEDIKRWIRTHGFITATEYEETSVPNSGAEPVDEPGPSFTQNWTATFGSQGFDPTVIPGPSSQGFAWGQFNLPTLQEHMNLGLAFAAVSGMFQASGHFEGLRYARNDIAGWFTRLQKIQTEMVFGKFAAKSMRRRRQLPNIKMEEIEDVDVVDLEATEDFEDPLNSTG